MARLVYVHHTGVSGVLHTPCGVLPAVIGRAGCSPIKREGDGATPLGEYALRALYYRPDRLARPDCALPVTAITQDMGWCDDPYNPMYNKRIKLPFKASHEHFWRIDHAYDLIIPLGFNDTAPMAGKGSAIFLHVMHEGARPTAGCISLTLDDMLRVIACLGRTSTLVIRG